MRKIYLTMALIVMFILTSTTVFASTNTSEQTMNRSEKGIVVKATVDEVTPKDNRHRIKKIEVGRIENRYIYPSDLSYSGLGPSESLVRAYVYKEIHYKVYRVRIGDPDYQVFLYDEYHTTWHGEKRDAVGEAWGIVQSKKSEVTKYRSALEYMIGILYH